MKKITPHYNQLGYVESYTVSDVSQAEIEANGRVSEWYMKISTIIFLLILIPPLFFMLSPVLYFVSRHILKKGGEFKKRKLLVIVNKVTLAILIYWIICLSIILICGTVYFLHRFGIIEVPFLDKITDLFKKL